MDDIDDSGFEAGGGFNDSPPTVSSSDGASSSGFESGGSYDYSADYPNMDNGPIQGPPPAYRADVFKAGTQGGDDWANMGNALRLDPDISPTEEKVYNDIFAAEGGMTPNPSSGAVGGFTQTTLNAVNANEELPDIPLKTTDFSIENVKDLYPTYFDDAMAGAAIGYNRANPGSDLTGSDMLEKIGDNNMASAVGDTLLRNGTGVGATMIQHAANAALPRGQQIQTGGGYGSRTQNALETIADDPDMARDFLDRLKDSRTAADPGEEPRYEYFQFPDD